MDTLLVPAELLPPIPTPQTLITQLRTRWAALPDHRRPNNNTQYTIGEAALSAFAVFFLQSPSFLAQQRALRTQKGRDNAETLFGLTHVPSDGQIRNLLDPVAPRAFAADYVAAHQSLRATGALDLFRDVADTWLVAADGVTYFSSTQISCPLCQHRTGADGITHYFHSAVTPVLVKPGRAQVLPLFPECITPQDGQTKQDCEVTAFTRWLAREMPAYAPKGLTFLFDALYTHQPLCRARGETYQ